MSCFMIRAFPVLDMSSQVGHKCIFIRILAVWTFTVFHNGSDLIMLQEISYSYCELEYF